MMYFKIFIITVLVTTTSLVSSTPQLTGKDALQYINMAEDFLQATNKRNAIQQARKCYVIAAYLDPNLERSAILGLIEIEDQPSRLTQLVSALPPSRVLLGDAIVHIDKIRPIASPTAIFEACQKVQKLRTVNMINISERTPIQEELLRYASSNLHKRLRTTLLEGGKVPMQSNIQDTLRAELLLLGGATQWSTAIKIDRNTPLGIGGQVDLSTLMGVDISEYLLTDGKWHAP
jgi:hypothetical protein